MVACHTPVPTCLSSSRTVAERTFCTTTTTGSTLQNHTTSSTALAHTLVSGTRILRSPRCSRRGITKSPRYGLVQSSSSSSRATCARRTRTWTLQIFETLQRILPGSDSGGADGGANGVGRSPFCVKLRMISLHEAFSRYCAVPRLRCVPIVIKPQIAYRVLSGPPNELRICLTGAVDGWANDSGFGMFLPKRKVRTSTEVLVLARRTLS